MSRWQTITMLLLALLAAATGWHLLMRPGEQKPDRFSGPSRPTYELIDFQLAAFDAEGRLAFRAESPRLVHDERRDGMAVSTPTFQLFNKLGQTWRATSEEAWIDNAAKRIDLQRDVHVKRESNKPADALSLTTEQLAAFTETRRLSSDHAVEVVRPGSILRGRGLEADLNVQSFELKADVDAKFAPKPKR
jgi:lipopolysaccharide export system protein LptC